MDSPAPGSGEPEQRLHPWSWLFVLLQQLKQFIVPLLVLMFLGRGDRHALWPLIGVLVLVTISLLQYFTFRYRVGATGLSIRSGLFERTLREVPFARIHNVGIHQSLLHRVFNVAEVRLESAGSAKPEAEMRVLSLPDALALERLVRHRGIATEAEASTPEATDELLTLSPAEVIRLGLVSNRGMIVVAAAFGLAWQVVPERFMGNFVEDSVRAALGYADHWSAGWMATASMAMAVLAVAIFLLRLLSVALAVVQYYGFRLTEEQRRLTVERGLLTRLRTSVARRRIQAWTLQENVLHRLFGRRALRIDTATGQAEEASGSPSRALRELAPITTPERCDQLIQHLLPRAQWPRDDWNAIPLRAWWRLFMPTALLLPAISLSLFFWSGEPWAWLPLLVLPWAAYSCRQHARRAAYVLDGNLVAVRGGWWSRWWRFAEIDKLQSLQLMQSPLDRKLGTASLWLDTAGASPFAPSLHIRFLPEAEARELHARLASALAKRRLQW